MVPHDPRRGSVWRHLRRTRGQPRPPAARSSPRCARPGSTCRPIEVGGDLGAVHRRARRRAPDVVFNALHGRFGEDGTIQGVLDWLGIPYTHSGVRASALAMDKAGGEGDVRRRRPAGRAGGVGRRSRNCEAADPMPLPYVIKPVNEGSSVGVEIMREGDNRRAEIARSWTLRPHGAGRGIHPRPRTDRRRDGRPRSGGDRDPRRAGAFYDYECEIRRGRLDAMSFPAGVHPDAYGRAMDVARRARIARSAAAAPRRADFRLRRHGGRAGPARAAGSQHAARPDAHIAAA